MTFYKKHKRGIWGSGIFHLIILILLIWLGFFTPLPLPGEEGILVNFGNSSTGEGLREPSPKKKTTPPPPVKREEEKVVEEVKTTPPPPKTNIPKTEPEPAKEEALTQTYEETAAIEAAKKKKAEEDRKKREQLEEERKRKEAEEIERKKQEEIERQRLAEIERIRQEELERQRIAEAERKRKEAEEQKINEINSRTKNAFDNSGSGTGGVGKDDGESQGVTYKGGNQGVPTGSSNSNTYGPGGSGSGNKGSGPSYALAGRSATSLPKPQYPGNEEGVVVVQVTVDRNGNVTKATAGVRGSNTMNNSLLAAAQKAALKAKFNLDNSAPAYQTGTITYRFVLD